MRRDLLIVDDEPKLLASVERSLSASYNVVTASSGSEGLTALASHSRPFPVVVADMRMPEMDGLTFIEAARKRSPSTEFLLLTGWEEQVAVPDAVNRARISGFLSKPCEGHRLKLAIEQALRRYDLVTGKNELLEKSFCGAINILEDILTMGPPEFSSQAARIEETLTTLLAGAGVPVRWEYYLAAKLCLLGVVQLRAEQRVQLEKEWAAATPRASVWPRAAESGKRLVQRIPQLELVGEIISRQACSLGTAASLSPTDPLEVVELGAALLRASIQWEALRGRRTDAATARQMLRRTMPELPAPILEALPPITGDELPVDTVETA